MSERVTLKWTGVNWLTVLLMVGIGFALAGVVIAGIMQATGRSAAPSVTE